MVTPRQSPSQRRVPHSGKTSLSERAGLTMPVARIGNMLRKGRYASRVSVSASAYLASVLEFLTAELINTASRTVLASRKKTKRITPRALTLAVRTDAELGALLRNVTLANGGVLPSVAKAIAKKKKAATKKRKVTVPKKKVIPGRKRPTPRA